MRTIGLTMVLALVLMLVVACKKKGGDERPKGKLCFAPHTADMFQWTKDGAARDYTEGKPLVIKYRGQSIALPNAQVGFDDAREGEPVAVMRGAELAESWKVSWRLGNDLCYGFRPFDPAKPERRPGFILDANQPDDRCTCN